MTAKDQMVLDALRRVKAGESTFADAVMLSIIVSTLLTLGGSDERGQAIVEGLFGLNELDEYMQAHAAVVAAFRGKDAAGVQCKH